MDSPKITKRPDYEDDDVTSFNADCQQSQSSTSRCSQESVTSVVGNDGIATTDVRCECLDCQTDGFDNLSVVGNYDKVHLECRICGQCWPTNDGRCYVGHGSPSRDQRLVTRLEVLRRGDHVVWTRVFGGIPCHHGIVVGIKPETGVVRLISLQRRYSWALVGPHTAHEDHSSGVSTDGQVHFENLELRRASWSIYVVDYKHCFPGDVIAARAISRLGERGYCIYSNNCEHFANWCKTGTDQSSQSEVALPPYRLCCNVALGASFQRLHAGSAITTASLINQITFNLGLIGLADSAAAFNVVPDINIDLILVLGVNAMVDGIAVGCDVVEAIRKRRLGVLSGIEFTNRVITSTVRGLLGAIGSIVGGNLVGAALAPVNCDVTMLVSAIAGSNVGWSVGWMIGRLLSRNWRRLMRKD